MKKLAPRHKCAGASRVRGGMLRLIMRLPAGLRPGAGIKRHLAVALAGLLAMAYGASLFYERRPPLYELLLLAGGLALVAAGIAFFVRKVVRMPAGPSASQTVSQRLYHVNVLQKGPRIVALGGGSGLSTLLRGLKQITSNITAIVTVADDGGGSGMLRDDLGMLPPGDIRNCILALSQAEPVMEQLLQYRFHEGQLKGQSFGNLLLAAMADTSGGFLEGVRRVSDILNVEGRVLPVTLDDVTLQARLNNGEVVSGESNIGMSQKTRASRIERLWLQPRLQGRAGHDVSDQPRLHGRAGHEVSDQPRLQGRAGHEVSDQPTDCTPLPEALEAIAEAEVIIIGPGSLYTSLLPNLLVPGVVDAIRRSPAPKVYVLNLMTQPGETEGFGAVDHLKALEAHCGPALVDVVLANNDLLMPAALLQRYREDSAMPIEAPRNAIESMGYRLMERPLLKVSRDMVRHSYSGLAAAISEVIKYYRI